MRTIAAPNVQHQTSLPTISGNGMDPSSVDLASTATWFAFIYEFSVHCCCITVGSVYLMRARPMQIDHFGCLRIIPRP